MWIYELSRDRREVALTFSQCRNRGELVIRIFVPSSGPIKKNKGLVVFDDMRNVERRTQGYAEAVLNVFWLLLRTAKHIRAIVQGIGSRVENGIVGAVEDGAVRLINVESAHSPTEREDSWSTAETPAA